MVECLKLKEALDNYLEKSEVFFCHKMWTMMMRDTNPYLSMYNELALEEESLLDFCQSIIKNSLGSTFYEDKPCMSYVPNVLDTKPCLPWHILQLPTSKAMTLSRHSWTILNVVIWRGYFTFTNYFWWWCLFTFSSCPSWQVILLILLLIFAVGRRRHR